MSDKGLLGQVYELGFVGKVKGWSLQNTLDKLLSFIRVSNCLLCYDFGYLFVKLIFDRIV